MSMVLTESRLLPSGPCSELVVAVTQRQAEEMEDVLGLETQVKAAVQLVSFGGQALYDALCGLQGGGEEAVGVYGPYATRVLEAFCVHASGGVPVYEVAVVHTEQRGVGGDGGGGDGAGGNASVGDTSVHDNGDGLQSENAPSLQNASDTPTPAPAAPQYTCSVVLPPPPGGLQGLLTISHQHGGNSDHSRDQHDARDGRAQAIVFESGVCGSEQEARQQAAVAACAFLMEEVCIHIGREGMTGGLWWVVGVVMGLHGDVVGGMAHVMCINTRRTTHTHMDTSTHIYICAHVYAHICTYMHIYAHICTNHIQGTLAEYFGVHALLTTSDDDDHDVDHGHPPKEDVLTNGIHAGPSIEGPIDAVAGDLASQQEGPPAGHTPTQHSGGDQPLGDGEGGPARQLSFTRLGTRVSFRTGWSIVWVWFITPTAT